MKKILLYVLTIIWSAGALAQNTVTATSVDTVYTVHPTVGVSELNGTWKFKKGDDKKWAKKKLKTGDWQDISIPNWDWEGGYLGYGWFRHEVKLPKKDTYVFHLGQVDDDCEVYFNGEKLELYIDNKPGSNNADTAKWNQWKKYRSYYIPQKLVDTKSNTIAIRVWNTLGAQGGIRYGNIYVEPTVFYSKLPIGLQGDWITTDGANVWYIGFYNRKVAYQEQIWDYGDIVNNDGIVTVNLIKGKLTKQVVAKAAPDGRYLIGNNDQSLQLYSTTETYKPLPPATETFKIEQPAAGKAHLTGYIKDHTRGGEGLIQVVDNNNTRDYFTRFHINSDGSFDAAVDITSAKIIELRVPGYSEAVRAAMAPGKTTFMVIDPEEFKIRVTDEYYNRERLTLYMGEMMLDSKLTLYTSWLNGLANPDKEVWNRFIYIADQYAAQGYGNEQLNTAALYIANNYSKYQDAESLKKAKLWSARMVMAAPGNHTYNSTLNAIMQNLGERLEGLQYLVKALDIAEKDKNDAYVRSYKQQIKQFV
ncbi:MAG: hypothetical protein EOP46_16330, partial [Sphingobacteriaceae bacterium]